ncbi:MAG: hypothetical protein BGP24_10010 [Lysobacterales bacterium 69-70]|nr:DUF4010 domain-containing protein [Xanthomonadaceae bacterium]ODU33278.1 MAG: hypothetical protein ABS97_13030 [Xanthomonadaceae bacterium SCN 69-320]ODV16600.1 MAG: hypothetical protein ABT27_19755 [Xanthomonadaceae bacterium SCN 69-25]OJZ00822.1 MAG: hypothetical protein BGP24_10010 [Xanthomonadales bacterium 69-70]
MDELTGLLFALAAGLLVGVERGWRQRAVAEGHRPAGLRTFGVIGLLGGLGAVGTQRWGPGILIALGAAVALALVAGYLATVWMHRTMGLTTLMAGLATFLIGALAAGGAPAAAAGAAVVMVLLLQLKAPLHSSIARLSGDELAAASQLLLISVVILPVLPDQGFGPFGAINPYRFWWAVVLIAGLSFAGYVAMRVTGPRRGLLITALLGGLVSSTATTAALARVAATTPALARPAAAGAILACAAMFARMIGVIAVTAPPLLAGLGPLLAAMAATGGALGLLWHRSPGTPLPEPVLPNPLALRFALGFSALLAGVALFSRALTESWGEAGLFLTSAIAGLADVDAIIVSIGRMVGEGIVPAQVAAWALLLGAAVNQGTKLALASGLAGRAVAGPLALAYALMAAAGATTVWLAA